MKTTNQIVKENNRDLMSRLIPEKESEPEQNNWYFIINVN